MFNKSVLHCEQSLIIVLAHSRKSTRQGQEAKPRGKRTDLFSLPFICINFNLISSPPGVAMRKEGRLLPRSKSVSFTSFCKAWLL